MQNIFCNDIFILKFCCILISKPRDNRPEIKVHIKEPLMLKENFFYQPLGRTDALKSPEHFPVPETRYTLKEMSIHWYMYAGSDFGPTKNNCKYFSFPFYKSYSLAD